MFFWTGDRFLTRCQLLGNAASWHSRKARMNYNTVRQKSFPYTKQDGLKCVLHCRLQRQSSRPRGKRVPSVSSLGYQGADPGHHVLPSLRDLRCCQPALWRGCWCSSCTIFSVAVVLEPGSRGKCGCSTCAVWDSDFPAGRSLSQQRLLLQPCD